MIKTLCSLIVVFLLGGCSFDSLDKNPDKNKLFYHDLKTSIVEEMNNSTYDYIIDKVTEENAGAIINWWKSSPSEGVRKYLMFVDEKNYYALVSYNNRLCWYRVDKQSELDQKCFLYDTIFINLQNNQIHLFNSNLFQNSIIISSLKKQE